MINKYEYLILKKQYKNGFRWIARDKNCELFAFKTMPMKFISFWTVESGSSLPCLMSECDDNILICVTWEDEKPTKIDDLIRDYESHRVVVDEKVKVTVPQSVADWIEHVKALKRTFKLEYLFDTIEMPDEVFDWLDERYGDTDILAKAWLDGYEVEKKLYTVELPNRQRLSKIGNDIKFRDAGDWFVKDLETKLTQAEIESVDPILMKIAEEVE